LRIVTGHLKGRVIPADRGRDDIRLTSSRLKEAIFAMLGVDLSGQTFLDLCAGSGQIGLEACSRGARVTLNEPDRRRCDRLRRLLQQWQVREVELHNAKAQAIIPRLRDQGRRFDTVYLDPPYPATQSDRPLSLSLFEQLNGGQLFTADGLLLVQHQIKMELPGTTGKLSLLRRRDYGNTALSIYRIDS